MQYEDDATLRLRAETTEFTKQLNGLNEEAKKLRATLIDIEKSGGKGSENWHKVRNEIKENDKAAQALAKTLKNMNVSAMSMKQLENYAKSLQKEIATMDRNSKEFINTNKRLGEVQREYQRAKQEAMQLRQETETLAKPSLWQKLTGGINSVGGAFKAIMALQIIGYLVEGAKAVFGISEKFEKYNAVLKNALGSEKLAKQSMEAIKVLAKNTAFTVDELTEGYVKLVNRGMKPTEKQMLGMADLAASQGKSFDQLVEAILDAQTNEFVRLKEFGIIAKKSGDQVRISFGEANYVVKNTPEAIQGVIDKLGGLQGVAGANAEMMKTLGGAWSNIQDLMTNTVAAIGEKLRPVFIGLFDIFAKTVTFIGAVVNASDPLVQVFTELFDSVISLGNSFAGLIRDIFPKTINGGSMLKIIMQALAVSIRATLMPITLAVAGLRLFADVMQGVINGGKALMKIIGGDFKGAAAAFEKSKTNFTNVKTHAVDSFDKIKKGFTDAFVTHPQKTAPIAALAAGQGEKKRQDSITDEQKKGQKKQADEAKKHLEEIKKANDEALKKLNKLQDDAYLEFVKRTKGEVEAEKVKIQQILDAELLEIEQSKANEELKAKLRKAAVDKYTEELKSLQEKQQREIADLTDKWLTSEENKKIKSLQETAKKDLEIARKTITDKEVLAKVELEIEKNLQKEIAKVKEEEATKATEKQKKQAESRLKDELFILKQEESAVKTKYNNLEFASRNNAKELVKIRKNRADEELRIELAKLKAEEQAEIARAKAEIKDETELKQKLEQINDSYRTREVDAEQKAANEKIKIEEKENERRKKNREAIANAFGSLLKGDVNAFVDSINQMNLKEQKAWQKQLQKKAEYLAMGAQMAQEAIGFLNDLAQKRADNQLAILQKEYEASKAINEKSIQEQVAAIGVSEQKIKDIKQGYSDEVKGIKEQEEKKITEIQDLYGKLKGENAKAVFEEQVNLSAKEKDEKIKAATKSKEEEIRLANDAKTEKIIAAEATMNAEIASIQKRTDVDAATKDRMVANARAKAAAEIESATTEATQKISLAEDTANKSINSAKEEETAKITLMKQLMVADDAKAKTLIQGAKDEADKKVKLAETEKNEKLKILEAEKAKRLQEKKDLEAKMQQEERDAKQKEYDIKLKAWNAQKKADIASALISGALAVIKALAMGFPVGLVMAALSGVMSGVQIAKIKNQAPPAAPTFAKGGSLYPVRGVGGLPEGRGHGSRPGDDGIMLVETRTGKVRGEMEGNEWIVGRDQTAANLPILQAMHEKSKRGDKTPIDLDKLPSLSTRMWQYGGKFRMYEDGGPVGDGGGGGVVEGTGQAQAGFEQAQKATAEHTELLKKILENNGYMRKELGMLLMKVAMNTAETVNATKDTAQAIRAQNFNALVDKLGSFK